MSACVTLNSQLIRLRPLLPSDRATYLAGFDKLSTASRRARFLSSKPALSEGEIDFFLHADGVDHIAIGAVTLANFENRADCEISDVEEACREQEGVGIVRVVRDKENAHVGELGIVVVDHWQGHGLGRALLKHIAPLARAQGITRLRLHTHSDNQAVRHLLEHAGDVHTEYDEGTAVVEVRLDEPTRH